MTPFKIIYDAGERILEWDGPAVGIRSQEEIDVMEDEQLADYVRLTTDVRNGLHKLASGVELSPEAEHALRTMDWLAGEARRQLRKR